MDKNGPLCSSEKVHELLDRYLEGARVCIENVLKMHRK